MLPESPTTALHAFVVAYRRHLKEGIDIRLPVTAKPLYSVVASDRGWKPAPARDARLYLERVIQQFLEASSRRESSLHVARADVAAIVRHHWGLAGHPTSISEALSLTGIAASESTASKWPAAVIQDAAVTMYVEADLRRRSRDLEPTSPQPSWLDDPAAWPPTDVRIRRLLVRQISEATLRTDGDGSDRPLSIPDFARLTGEDPTDFAIAVLHDVTAEYVLEWFYEGRSPCGALVRHFRHAVGTEWFGDYLLGTLAPSLAGAPRESGASYKETVRAATQMLMFDAAVDGPRLRRAVRRRTELAPLLGSLVAGGTPRDFARTPPDMLDERAKIETFALLGVDAHKLSSGLRTPPRGGATAMRMAKLADAIWAAASQGERGLARSNIRDYLSIRDDAISTARGDRAARELIAISDRTVNWACVVASDPAAANDVVRAIRRNPAGVRHGYLSLTWRSEALLASKQDRWGPSLEAFAMGAHILGSMRMFGQIHDDIELESSGNQLWLAATGISVRMLEWHLARATQVVAADRVIESFVRGSLSLSRAALDSLLFLEAQGLHDTAASGHIATRAWRVQTRIIRFRVVLAAYTAHACGLVSRESLKEGYRTASIKMPLAPLRASRIDVDGVSMDGLVAAYLDLISLEELRAVHAPQIVPLALHLGLLNGGRLPLAREPNAELVRSAPFLDADPVAIDGGLMERDMDVVAIVSWLRRQLNLESTVTSPSGGELAKQQHAMQGIDAGFLSWIDLRRLVARKLDEKSEGLFRTFRIQHDPYRPKTPSRD